jgi:hypothetical protein
MIARNVPLALIICALMGCGDGQEKSARSANQATQATTQSDRPHSTRPAPTAQVDQTGNGMLPAGRYIGTVSSFTTTMTAQYRFNPVTGGGMEMVPVVTPVLQPSPLGDLLLDGQGRYTLSGITERPNAPAGGTYQLDAQSTSITFVTGPLESFKTTLNFTSEGAPTITARGTTESKDAKPDEPKETELVIHFGGTVPNPKFANRAAGQPDK